MAIHLFFNLSQRELSDGEFNDLISKVHHSQLPHILKFRQRKDAQNTLIGRLLVSHAFKTILNRAANFEEMVFTEAKRPVIPESGLNFSISHSQFLTACAVAVNGDVGLDVEKITPIDLNIFRPYFEEAEYKSFSTGNDFDLFYSLWTKKEAILKAYGHGLTVPLIDVYASGNQGKVHGRTWHLRTLGFPEGYVGHIATEQVIDNLIYYPLTLSMLAGRTGDKK